MTLEQGYFLAEIVAAFLLIGSLVFVGYQIRQSQKIERAKAQRDLLQRVAEWSWKACEQPFADAIVMGLWEYEEADAARQSVFGAWMFDGLTIAESALNMHRDKFFSEGTWGGLEGMAIGLISTPGGREYWKYASQFMGSEIVEFLNRRVAELGDAAPNFIDYHPAIRKRRAELLVAKGMANEEDASIAVESGKSVAD